MSRMWLIVCLCFGGWLQAQTPECDSLKKVYPFLRLDQNALVFPGDTIRWVRFFRQIDQMRQGELQQLQVMHLGGSHVQGGSLSRRIRHRLADLVADSSGGQPGFFFPYPLAGTNSPSEIQSLSEGEWTGARSVKRGQPGPFGLAALNARSGQPNRVIDITYRDGKRPPARYQSVRIYGQSMHQQMDLEPLGWQCPDNMMMDSIRGVYEWCYDTNQDIVSFRLTNQNPDKPDTFIIQGIQYIQDSPGLVFHQVGANGVSLPATLRCEGLAEQLMHVRPDLVILGIGVNDAHIPTSEFRTDRFISRYDSLLTLFRQANPQVLFIFLTNNDTYYRRRPNKNGLEVREAMFQLAQKWDAGVWDQFTVMGGLGSIHSWWKNGLAKKDRLHFTAKGYTLVADLFADAVDTAYVRFVHPPQRPAE